MARYFLRMICNALMTGLFCGAPVAPFCSADTAGYFIVHNGLIRISEDGQTLNMPGANFLISSIAEGKKPMRVMPVRLSYRAIIVACCFTCASGYGVFYTLGVFFNSVRHEFNWSATLISSIHAIHCILFGVALPIIGKLSTRYGARPVFLSCSLLIGIGFSLCSQIENIWEFYLFYGIASVGAAVTTSLPLALVQRWFVKRRGIALGFVSAGLGFGAMIFPIMAGVLISNFDWRSSYLFMGILVGSMMVIASLFIKDSPDATGAKPLGAPILIRAREKKVGTNPAFINKYPSEDETWSISELFKTRTFFLICIIWIFASICTHLIIIHLVPFAENLGMPKGEAAAVFGMIGGVSILSRIFGGYTSQKLGWKTTLIICSFSIAALLFWLSCSKTEWMIYVFVVLYGFLFGIRLTTFPGLIGDYFGTKSITEVMSYFWSVAAVAGLVGPLLGGFIYDLTGTYPMAFIFGAILYLLVGALSTRLTPPQKAV